jgi:molybdopterin converting factor subunit 1
VRVKVRLFARLRDIVGVAELEQDVAARATIRDVWAGLVAAHPELARYAATLSCARNADYARMDAVLGEDDEVAFLPPVSGGSGSPAPGCV